MPNYVTPKKAGALMHVSAATAKKYARLGKLPWILTPGGQIRIDADAIQALMDESQQRWQASTREKS